MGILKKRLKTLSSPKCKKIKNIYLRRLAERARTNYRFIQPANELEVITSGEYQGYLALQQHRYFIGGGSYDWYWLFTPDGKEIGPLGEELSIK
jgi:hypothetical protein